MVNKKVFLWLKVTSVWSEMTWWIHTTCCFAAWTWCLAMLCSAPTGRSSSTPRLKVRPLFWPHRELLKTFWASSSWCSESFWRHSGHDPVDVPLFALLSVSSDLVLDVTEPERCSTVSWPCLYIYIFFFKSHTHTGSIKNENVEVLDVQTTEQHKLSKLP